MTLERDRERKREREREEKRRKVKMKSNITRLDIIYYILVLFIIFSLIY